MGDLDMGTPPYSVWMRLRPLISSIIPDNGSNKKDLCVSYEYIAYDTMDTELHNDDALVFADPYDTADHAQNGYPTARCQRFCYTRFDHGAMKESERVQHHVTESKP